MAASKLGCEVVTELTEKFVKFESHSRNEAELRQVNLDRPKYRIRRFARFD